MQKQSHKQGFLLLVLILLLVFAGLVCAALYLFFTSGMRLVSNNGSVWIESPGAIVSPTARPDDTSPTPLPTYPAQQNGTGGSDFTLQLSPPPVTPTPEPLQNGVLTTEEISQAVSPSVVGILGTYADYENEASGTGILMSADGYIVTNNHVIEGFDTLTVVLHNGDEYPATLIGRDRLTDLAVLKIEATGLVAASFGDSNQLTVGERAVCIGNPFGMELSGTLTQGVISAVNRSITVDDLEMTVIQVDAAVNPGNSGGPLINQYGQVVGIISSKIMGSYGTTVEGLGFAIPTAQALPIINTLLSIGHIAGRPAIGITGTDVAADMRAGTPAGFQVAAVNPDSDAARAGVQVGDIIIKFNDADIHSRTDINVIKNKLFAGDEVTIVVYRNGQELEITFKLMEESGQ